MFRNLRFYSFNIEWPSSEEQLSETDTPALFRGDTLFNAGVGNCRGGGDPEALFDTFATHLTDSLCRCAGVENTLILLLPYYLPVSCKNVEHPTAQ